MKTITDALEKLHIGSVRTYRNLQVFPLVCSERFDVEYVTLDQAARNGDVVISECPSTARQATIVLENLCACPIFLLDGQELTGAMQDRVLNVSLLAPPGQSLILPVTCVEAARWEPGSSEFNVAPRIQFATGRAQRIAQVTVSLLAGEGPASDQVDVWATIDERSASLGVSSDTRAHHALFKALASRIASCVRAIKPWQDQVGTVYAICGQVVGLDLFESAQIYRECHGKLIASAEIDALAAPQICRDEASPADVQQFLERVGAARTLRFAGVGALGEDVRLCGENLTGGALIGKGRVVHMSAFDLQACA